MKWVGKGTPFSTKICNWGLGWSWCTGTKTSWGGDETLKDY